MFSDSAAATTTFLPSIAGTYDISVTVIDASESMECNAIVPINF
jgi:hypothetical protein